MPSLVEQLLVQALHAGIGILVFWEMTPCETTQEIKAANWRLEQGQRARAWLAWHTAALSRAKKMPPLARLVNPPEAKTLRPDELEARRREFAEMRSKWKNRGRP